MMKQLRQNPLLFLRRLWRDTDGFVVSTEVIVTLTLTVCLLVVGVAAARAAILYEFLDVAESLASRENGYVFTDDAEMEFFPDEDSFPDEIGSILTQPTPVDASKESQDLFPGASGGENP